MVREVMHGGETIQSALLAAVKRDPKSLALADSSGAEVNFSDAITKAVFLAGRLAEVWKDQKNVGILIPPSVGGALVNWAALMMGKIPVNLNYTLSQDGIISCIKQCGLTDVVVSGKLMSRLKLELPVRVHVLEDMTTNPRLTEKLQAFFLSKFSSSEGLLKKLGGADGSPDDLATIIFSSGSTGAPKGVMLSHRNVITNVEQFREVYAFAPEDRLLGVLPFFHSFGFMATVAGPAVVGFGTVFHFNPMESKAIGPLIEKHGVTVLPATPTFLQFYLRGCSPGQLKSLRMAVVAGEKLPDRIADAFEEKFGCRPYEAYGCTECAPGITANRLSESKKGSIGKPLPGMELKVVNPDTREEVESGAEGLLVVKGANVMRGYLALEEKTAEVLQDGWYETGDIVKIDEEGFIWIAGRLSRFSKIGGEMVPHGTVEENLHKLAALTEQKLAVTGLPDDKKGERLVVLHSLNEETLTALLEKLPDAEMPNLWKPKAAQFIAVEALPYLGTGKLDLKSLQQMAEELG